MQNNGVVSDKEEYEIPTRWVNLWESWRKKKGEQYKSLAIWQSENVKSSAFCIFETKVKPEKFCALFLLDNTYVSITHSFLCARGIR